jgi:hypothetical protein
MELYRKIIIIIICLIFFYILYRLITQRLEIYGINSESFQTQTVNQLQTANSNPLKLSTFNINGVNLTNGITDTKKALQLRQYCIKAAMHPAYDGAQMSLDMLNYTMSRGCRFLVFEIYWASPTVLNTSIATTNPNFENSACPVVAMSNDSYIPASNKIALQDVLNAVNQTAFTSMCPNNGDPLFIQLCMKYNNNVMTGTSMYDSIASIISNTLGNLYYGEVKSTTTLDKLMGKIVLIMDMRNHNSFYAADSPKLTKFINMDCPSNSMQVYNYSDLNGASDNQLTLLTGNSGYITSAKEIDEVLPMSSTQLSSKNTSSTAAYMMSSNYSAMNMVLNQGVQITPMLFWSNEYYLSQYENMFNYGNAGIIPMSLAMRFAQKNSNSKVKSMIYP